MKSELELRMRLRNLQHVRATYDVQESRDAWDHVRPYAAPDSAELIMRLDASIATLQWVLNEDGILRSDTIMPPPPHDESGSGILTALGAISAAAEGPKREP